MYISTVLINKYFYSPKKDLKLFFNIRQDSVLCHIVEIDSY